MTKQKKKKRERKVVQTENKKVTVRGEKHGEKGTNFQYKINESWL